MIKGVPVNTLDFVAPGCNLLSYPVVPKIFDCIMELSLQIRVRTLISGNTLKFSYCPCKHTVMSRRACWCFNVISSLKVLVTVGSSVKKNSDRGPVLLDVLWTFCAVASVLVLLRAFTRARILKHWEWDDSLIAIAMVIVSTEMQHLLVSCCSQLGVLNHECKLQHCQRTRWFWPSWIMIQTGRDGYSEQISHHFRVNIFPEPLFQQAVDLCILALPPPRIKWTEEQLFLIVHHWNPGDSYCYSTRYSPGPMPTTVESVESKYRGSLQEL